MHKVMVGLFVSMILYYPGFSIAAPPTVSAPAGPLMVAEDAALPITGVSIADDENEISIALTVTNGKLNVSLMGEAKKTAGDNNSKTLTLRGPITDVNATLGTLSFQGNRDYHGNDALHVKATDSTQDVEKNVSIQITHVNDEPENTLPPSFEIKEDTLSKLNGVGVKDVDGDGNFGLKSVQVTVTQGTLNLTKKGTVSIGSGESGSKTVTLIGENEKDFNDTLQTLNYQGNKNYSGVDTLTMLSTDKANATDSDTVNIRIENVVVGCDWSKSGKERYAGDLDQNWSAGPLVSYSLLQYNLADKKSSLNAKALGAGISFRRYRDSDLRWFAENKLNKVSSIKEGSADIGVLWNDYPKGGKYSENFSISDIPAGCRATTTDLLAEGNKIVAWFSIAPTMYVFKDEDEDDLGTQIAVNFGFLNDIFNVGIGWNLSGGNAGEWFILAGPSIGFKF